MSTAFTNTGGWPILQSEVVLAWYTSPGAAAQRSGGSAPLAGAGVGAADSGGGDGSDAADGGARHAVDVVV